MKQILLLGQMISVWSCIGIAVTCYLAWQLARHAYCYLRPSSLPRYKHAGKESWALVTGATDGIGFGFAQELCSRGFNVFIHGRSQEKLLRRQGELQAQFPDAKIKVVVYDAVNLSDDIDALIATEIGDARLTVLVNNVGGDGTGFPSLAEMDYQSVNRIITLNATFMTQITRVLLPILKRNGPSLIINVSSAASYGMPWLSVYSGSKGYVDSISHSLDAELTAEKTSVEALALRVGNVQSQGNRSETSLFTPDARTMARAGLNRVGCGRILIWGYWPHVLQGLAMSVLPRALMVSMIAQRLGAMRRDASLKRKNT